LNSSPSDISRSLPEVISAVEDQLDRFGFIPFETQIIQPASLFLTRAGDQIADHLFTFTVHGEHYALRPEFTSAAVAEYLATGDTGRPARLRFSGYVFEENDEGKPSQQYSVGAELFGVSDPTADADVMAATVSALRAADANDFVLQISSVELTRLALAQFGLDTGLQRLLFALLNGDHAWDTVYLQGWVDAIAPADLGDALSLGDAPVSLQAVSTHVLEGTMLGQRTQDDIVQRLLLKAKRAGQRDQIRQTVAFLKAWNDISLTPEEASARLLDYAGSRSKPVVDRFLHIIDLLAAKGADHRYILIRPALSRNWDYYTGAIFECRLPDGRLVAGGGRYDDFASQLGARQPVPAVGVGIFLGPLVSMKNAAGLTERTP